MPENQDTRQSLTDDLEEDEFLGVIYDHSCSEKLSLLSSQGKKRPAVISQLDTLKERQKLPSTHVVNLREGDILTSLEKLENHSSRVALDMQEFAVEESGSIQTHPEKECQNDSDEDSISDEVYAGHSEYSVTSGVANQQSCLPSFQCENQDEASTWSVVLEEANELVSLHKRTGISSSIAANSAVRMVQKGGRGKDKFKFSIRAKPQKEYLSWPYEVKDEKEGATQVLTGQNLPREFSEHSMAELLEGLQKVNNSLPCAAHYPADLLSVDHRYVGHSVPELLEHLQGKNGPLTGESKMNKTKAKKLAGKRTSPLGDRYLDNQDAPEFVSVGTSSEDEDNDQKQLSFAMQKSNAQTMVDLFQEAFTGSVMDAEEAPFKTSKRAGNGYHGKLQQVVQIEKQRHMEFLKQIQIGVCPDDESRCISGRILSRFLDAKLTVCRCLFSENSENSQSLKFMDEGTAEKLIIFNSKLCDNVELELGKVIRIHPPWKEVQTKEEGNIILCTFFSEIMA